MLAKLHARARAALTSTRGDLVAESVIASIIVSLMSIGLVSLFMVMLSSSHAAATNTSRTSVLEAQIASHAPMAEELIGEDPVEVVLPDAPGGPTTALVWAEPVSELEVSLHGAVPRSQHGNGESVEPWDCVRMTSEMNFNGSMYKREANPACLTESLPVVLDLAGVDSTVVAADGQKTNLSTDVADDVTEMRYVVLVTQVHNPSDAAIVLKYTEADGGTGEHPVEVSASGYYYGGLDVAKVSKLEIAGKNIAIDQDRSMIYEAPR